MYNMSMLGHRFSNERWGGGRGRGEGGGALKRNLTGGAHFLRISTNRLGKKLHFDTLFQNN